MIQTSTLTFSNLFFLYFGDTCWNLFPIYVLYTSVLLVLDMTMLILIVWADTQVLA